MRIIPFPDLTPTQLAEAARILRDAIHGESYKPPGEAEEETASFLTDPERFALAAVEGETVLGWIGGVRGYSHALELHPLVVDPPRHRQGIGASLIRALEAQAAAEGFLTIHLGADDDFGGSSLFGAELFPDPLARLAEIEPRGDGHPFFFYRRMGYAPVGILPDANGPGRPDIFMARRVSRPDAP
jgi:aminoglycoside 6'-N-acetyltransferase I